MSLILQIIENKDEEQTWSGFVWRTWAYVYCVYVYLNEWDVCLGRTREEKSSGRTICFPASPPNTWPEEACLSSIRHRERRDSVRYVARRNVSTKYATRRGVSGTYVVYMHVSGDTLSVKAQQMGKLGRAKWWAVFWATLSGKTVKRALTLIQ